ncbi:MAG: DUF2723 domain-containing protein [Thermoanaerobaculales bacterium]|nr:DUF2723 domain-containing protein [Thermoanaerobaculales bacterium]
MTRERLRAAATLLAIGGPLAVYLATLAREVTETDSGELAAVAATLGIAHPPGYPLFTIVGWLCTFVPVGSVAFRVGLVSALAAAGAVAVVFRLGLAVGVAGAASRASSDRGDRPADAAAGVAVVTAALAAAMLLAFGRTLWSQAVIVEVYGLQTLLVALVLAACWRAAQPGADPLTAWPLAVAAAGLAAVNHLTGVLLWPAVLATLALGLGRSRPPAMPLLARTGGAAALPLLLTLYLPLRSAASPEVRWTVIDALQPFLVHVSARQYHGLWGSRGLRLEELARFAGDQLPAEATWLLPLLAVVGLVVVARRRPVFALATGLALASTLVYNLGYPIHDIAAYYLPVLTVLGVWAVAGAVTLTTLAARRHPVAGAATAAALVAVSSTVAVDNWRDGDRHDDRLIACAVRDTLAPLAPDAVLLTGRWDTTSSPALYEQHVAGLRRDVLVIDIGRTADPRFGPLLEAAAPDLAAACAPDLAAAREVGLRAERGERIDTADGRRRLERLRRALVLAAVARRPTYVTSDLYTSPLVRGLSLVPEGLVARAGHRTELGPMSPDAITGPCGTRDRLRFPAHKLVWDDYRVAMLNRARTLRRHGLTEEAAAFAARAAEIGVPPEGPE